MTDQTVRPDTPEADASADDASPAVAGGAMDAQDLQQELEQVRAQYARALADYQNLERRSREDRAEVGRAALAGVVVGLLPVLDDLQRAIEAADNASDATDDRGMDEASWLEGVRLVAQKFAQTLQQLGMEEIHALGQPFDPNRHEAVGGAPGPDGQVVHLLRRGYLLKGQVVRPAMVMVGNGEADGRAGSPAPASTDSSSAG